MNAYRRRYNWLKNHPPERRTRRKHGIHRHAGYRAEVEISHNHGRRHFPFGMADASDLTNELVNRGLRIGGADWLYKDIEKVRVQKTEARRKWFTPFVELFRRRS